MANAKTVQSNFRTLYLRIMAQYKNTVEVVPSRHLLHLRRPTCL